MSVIVVENQFSHGPQAMLAIRNVCCKQHEVVVTQALDQTLEGSELSF